MYQFDTNPVENNAENFDVRKKKYFIIQKRHLLKF